jgi:hypothetical protein
MVEDELDLDIDMQPRYAYNAGRLGRIPGKRKRSETGVDREEVRV